MVNYLSGHRRGKPYLARAEASMSKDWGDFYTNQKKTQGFKSQPGTGDEAGGGPGLPAVARAFSSPTIISCDFKV